MQLTAPWRRPRDDRRGRGEGGRLSSAPLFLTSDLSDEDLGDIIILERKSRDARRRAEDVVFLPVHVPCDGGLQSIALAGDFVPMGV